jgi:hypothetical protein
LNRALADGQDIGFICPTDMRYLFIANHKEMGRSGKTSIYSDLNILSKLVARLVNTNKGKELMIAVQKSERVPTSC